MSLTGVDLSTYVLLGRYDLPEPTRTTPPDTVSLLAQEVSAVTYNWDTDTLFVLGDGGTAIVQVTKTGQLIDSMTLAPGSSPQGTTFYDPEGLTYIGGGQFVMTEERDRNAVRFTYDAGTTLTRADAQTVTLGTFVGNVGLEGLSYDPQTAGYIFVKEISPEGIFQTTIDFDAGTASNGSPTTVNSVDLFDPALLGLADFADVFALSNLAALLGTADTGNLLVLSQESGRIVETDRSGNILSSLTIVSNPGNPLTVANQQHEGLTMDADGVLYVVSENGGGDFDHPQLWVYAPSSVPNQAPTAVALANATTAILENTNTTARIRLADVVVTDDGLGTNQLALGGADAAFFQVDSTGLYLKAGTVLDFEAKPSYSVTITVDDAGVGTTPDASTTFTLNVTDVVNEDPGKPILYISEVAPWSSGNSPFNADWFEVTNLGSAAIDITGWRMDDNSNLFSASVALSGITSIAAGETVVFIETSSLATTRSAFLNTWFGANAPAGLQVGGYSGSGVGLSTGGDAVNLYSADGVLQANVVFGASTPSAPFRTFNNAQGLNGTTISKLSAIGENGGFAAAQDANEIGSPGSIGRLFVSEVAPWSSGSSPIGADWFEVTNGTAFAIDITGWRIDDNSESFAASVALNGITSIAAGESVIFIESGAPATARQAFLNTWFGANAPAGLQIGTYSGSSVGLSTGGDAVNLYNATGVKQAGVAFGVSTTTTPFRTFENPLGLNNVTLTQLSTAGTNGAFAASNPNAGSTETGSPGENVAVNDPPVARADTLSDIAEDSGPRTIAFAALTANDLTGPAGEAAQTLAVTGVANPQGGTVAIVGGQVVFTPAANYFGAAGFDYTVRDNGTSYGLSDPRSATGRASFSITPVNDAPAFTSAAAFQAEENATAIGTVAAGDVEGDAVAFAITGGADQAFFAIDSITGALRFLAAPDFETPEDANGDNVYLVEVTATDGPGAGTPQAIAVTVTDLAETGLSILGTRGMDVITGTSGGDTIDGRNDLDVLLGADGNDWLLGGTGNDTLEGGRGADTAEGGLGDDGLSGGLGADLLLGGRGNDVLDGGEGADTIDGGADNDQAIGGAGDDSLFGASGNDSLDGGDGNDTLAGGAQRDTLAGGDGQDRLVGGDGQDRLVGGADADVFVLGGTTASRDTIADFVSGLDSLEVSLALFGGDLTEGGDATGHFVLGLAPTAATATFLYQQSTGRLFFDADGTGAGARMLVAILEDQAALAATDFSIVA